MKFSIRLRQRSYEISSTSIQTTFVLSLRVATQAATLFFLGRLIGPADLGFYIAAASVAVIVGLVPSLGLGYVMLERASYGSKAIEEVWGYAFLQTVISGSVLALAFIAVGEFAISMSGEVSTVLISVALSELILNPTAVLLGFLVQSNGETTRSQIVQWLPLAFRSVAVFPCFLFDQAFRLSMFGILQCVFVAAGVLVSFWVSRQYLRFKWNLRLPSLTEFKSGGWYAATHLTAIAPMELDKVVSVNVVGMQQGGIYAVASRVFSAAAMPITGFLLSSQLGLFKTRSDKIHGDYLVKKVGLVAAAWGVVCILPLFFVAPLLQKMFGPSFTGVENAIKLFALVAPLFCLRIAGGTILVAHGHPQTRMIVELAGSLFLVALMNFMGSHLGIPGLVIGFAGAELFMASIVWLFILNGRYQ